uniref:GDSL esterase/lipase n=1 Tax=Quercus lobata TaxID=97700 RepID=A0A7N2LR28_QUELO
MMGKKCNEIFGSSLFLMGEIGGNDYNYPFFLYRSIEEIQTFVPLVIKAIASAINELIELGAVTLMVPGNLPIGCSAAYLTYYETADTDQYDPETGCLNWLNKFSEYHNDQLQKELSRIQALHPHTNIIYADFYNSSMRFYRNPSQYGFTGGALTACCGGGGPYNFNTSAECGDPSVSACDDPSKYVSWDGIHLTEAAYRWITNGLLEGPYTIPQISISCVSQDA